MPKPTPANASARQKAPPEVADADIDAKPSEGSASTPTTPVASAKPTQAPSEGTAS